jgi:hypothetical protein
VQFWIAIDAIVMSLRFDFDCAMLFFYKNTTFFPYVPYGLPSFSFMGMGERG